MGETGDLDTKFTDCLLRLSQCILLLLSFLPNQTGRVNVETQTKCIWMAPTLAAYQLHTCKYYPVFGVWRCPRGCQWVRCRFRILVSYRWNTTHLSPVFGFTSLTVKLRAQWLFLFLMRIHLLFHTLQLSANFLVSLYGITKAEIVLTQSTRTKH